MNQRHFRSCLHIAMLGAVALFTGCSTTYPLMPTPAVYVGPKAKPLLAIAPAAGQKASIDLLYVTDRAPGTEEAKTLPYSAERSHSMAFGNVTIEFGEGVPLDTLVAQSTLSKRTVPLDLKLGPTTELGRFPPISYGVEATPMGLVRTPAAIDAHQKAAAMLQAEVARQLAAAPRKEVVLFVHGYANTFQDASFTMGELCHFLGREFVCAIFTWPAGGSRGLFMGRADPAPPEAAEGDPGRDPGPAQAEEDHAAPRPGGRGLRLEESRLRPCRAAAREGRPPRQARR